jgi:hypothetical protein
MRARALILTLALAVSLLAATNYWLWSPSASITLGKLSFNPYYALLDIKSSNLAYDFTTLLQPIFGNVPAALYFNITQNPPYAAFSSTTDSTLWTTSFVPSDVGIVLVDTGVLYNPAYFACSMTGTAPAALVDMLNQLGVCGDYGTITWGEIAQALADTYPIYVYDNPSKTFVPPPTTETFKYCVTNSMVLREIGLINEPTNDTLIILQPTSWTQDDVGHGTMMASALCGQQAGINFVDKNGNLLGYVNMMYGPARGAKVFVVNSEVLTIVIRNFVLNLTAGVTTPTVVLAKAVNNNAKIYIDYDYAYLGHKAAIVNMLMSLNDAAADLSTWITNNNLQRLVLLTGYASMTDKSTAYTACAQANGTAFYFKPLSLTTLQKLNITLPSNTNGGAISVPTLLSLTTSNNYLAIVAPTGNEGEDVATLNTNNIYIFPAQCYKWFWPNTTDTNYPLTIPVSGLILANATKTWFINYVYDKYGNYDLDSNYWMAYPAAYAVNSLGPTKITFILNSNGTQFEFFNVTTSGVLAFTVKNSVPEGGGAAPALSVPLPSTITNGTSIAAGSVANGTSVASAFAVGAMMALLNDPSITNAFMLKSAYDTMLYGSTESKAIGYGPLYVQYEAKIDLIPKGISWYSSSLPLPPNAITPPPSPTPITSPSAFGGTGEGSITVMTTTTVINGQTITTVTTITGTATAKLKWQIPFVFVPIPFVLRRLSRKRKK